MAVPWRPWRSSTVSYTHLDVYKRQIKRTTKFIRDASGTMLLSASDTKIVKKYMPYDR